MTVVRKPRIVTSMATLVRERVVRRMLPNGVSSDLNRNDRVGAIHRAWGHVFSNHIEGAYYEFGVYEGATFRAAHRVYGQFARWLQGQLAAEEPWRRTVAAQYARYRHHFYAFDTFSGMPANAEDNTIFAEGNFQCSVDAFAGANRAAGIVEGEMVRYFIGPFADVARHEAERLRGLQPTAIINIDCDLYRSTAEALAIVADKLVQGTVLLLDDWNSFAARRDQGGRRALKEWLEERPTITVEPWFAYEYVGQAFLVHVESSGSRSGPRRA